MSFRGIYCLYGLMLEVPFPLPLAAMDGSVPWDYQVTIDSTVVPLFPPSSRDLFRLQTLPDGWQLHRINRNGEWVDVHFTKSTRQIVISGSVVNRRAPIGLLMVSVIAGLLYSRGHILWHGTTLHLDGRTILIAGPSGSGKSTTVAALMARGLSLVSEDLTILQERNVIPGYPLLRLTRQTADAVIGHETLKPVFHAESGDNKYWLPAERLSGGWHSQSLPLAAIYVLRRRSSAPSHILPLSSSQGVTALMKLHYAPHLFKHTPEEKLVACATLAQQTPMRAVVAQNKLETLSDLVEKLLIDAAQLTKKGA